MKKHLHILKKCPLFEGIEEEKLLTMLNCLGARVEFFDKKYTVMAEGNSAKYIGIVLSGSVQIIRIDYYGNRSIIGEAGAAGVFMEAFACAECEEIPVSVTVSEPADIMFIDCAHILHTCSNNCGFHQRLIFNLMKSLAKKNISFYQRIEVTSKRTTRDKLLSYLALRSKNLGKTDFDIPFDRQELADYLEVDRSGLSLEISRLRREGIIENRKNHFKLL